MEREARPDGHDARRDIAGNVVAALTRYVARAGGEDALARVLALAAEPLSAPELLDDARWYSADRVYALADAATAVTGDLDIGRRAGEELFRVTCERGLDSFIKAAGAPEAALVNLVSYGSKMSQGRQLVPLDVGVGEMVLEGTSVGIPTHPFLCGFGPGFWARVPELFGAAGTVIEERCIRRGDPHCTYRIRWTTAGPVPESTLAEESASAEALIGAFERLQATASELAHAQTLDDLLERMVAAADRALVAPRFVAAVRARDGRIVSAGRGLDVREAQDCAERLMADPTDDTYGSPVVASLHPRQLPAGLIAALLPPAATPGAVDERLLSAYAGHATAVLDAVLARELAERNHEVSRELLDLAQSLAATTSPPAVCERVIDAVVRLTNCDFVATWRWDQARRTLDLACHHGGPVEYLRLSEEDVNGLGGLDEGRTNVVLDIGELVAPKLVAEMQRSGLTRAVVTPVSARGTLLGLITAGFKEARPVDDDLRDRLHGVADLAATALDNALLVERMRHQSLHDSLTGLPNRPLIEDRVHQAIRQAARKQGSLALMFIDLDRFKNVNDTLGHTAGDLLIRQVAHRLASAVRSQDTIARMGGDEFVLLLPDATHESACVVAEKVIGSLRTPFDVDGRQLFVSCSIGVALWPLHGADYERLLLNADAAMYEAKGRGRNTYAVHSGPTTRRRELLDLDSRLHIAIEHDELVVHYQPQVDLMTGRIVGMEALMRWDHPELGLLTPDRFLHLAEESGVIARIDRWVRDGAFAQARIWADSGEPIRVAVNLSTADLRRPELAVEIADAMARAAIGPDLVELEITDRVALAEDDLRPALDSLAGLGVRLAVDDFGVGTSVLGRLQQGPFHTLKVDRSLVSQIDVDRRQAAILQALVTMARELGLTVVAEGVETSAQEAVVRASGCEMAQGYLFGRPAVAARATAGPLAVAATGGRPDR